VKPANWGQAALGGPSSSKNRPWTALNIGRQSADDMAHNALHGTAVWGERQYYMENERRIKKGLTLPANPLNLLAGREGFEPPLTESESAVLPLDDLPANLCFHYTQEVKESQ
jgi:hypothetical protein